jgi:hypothetical protein
MDQGLTSFVSDSVYLKASTIKNLNNFCSDVVIKKNCHRNTELNSKGISFFFLPDFNDLSS